MKNKTISLVLFIFIFFSLFLPLVNASFDIPSDYISWWRFENNSNDVNGINNGTVYGATYNATGKFGGDYNFNSSSYISIPNNNVLNPTSTMTVSAWIKSPNPTGNAYGMFVAKNSDAAWQIRYNSNTGCAMFVVKIGSTFIDQTKYSTNTTMQANIWYNVIGVYDGSKVITYVNGLNVGSYNAVGAIGVDANPLLIGKRNDGYNFIGQIDEVIIYNRSLSATEITQLYNMQVTDTVYPTFNNYYDNNASLVGSGTGLFNVTLANTNGTVLLEINNQNYTATNLTANVYNVSVSLTNGTYSYKWHSWGNGTSHLYNFSDIRSYTINNSDTTYPIFSNNLTSIANGSQYNPSNNYQFNITIANTNGTAGIEFNNVNYTLSNISNSFYWNAGSLGAGSYNYYFWGFGNGASHNYNNSQIFSYTINKAIPQGILTNTTSWTIFYPTSVTIGLSESNLGDGDVSYKIYRDNIDKGTGETITLGAGNYNYVLNTTGGQNYTSNSSMDAKTLIVNKNTSTQTSLTFDKTSPQSYPNSITPTCSVIIGQGTPVLSLNGTIITSGNPIILGVGTWSFNCSLADNGNYSYAENVTNFQITQNNSYVLSLYVNPSWNVNYGTQTNVTGSGCPSQLTCNLYNNVSGVVSNSINLTLGAGSYNFTYNTTGNANYSSMSVSNILIVSQANGYSNLSLNRAENNLTLAYTQQTNITASTPYGTLIIYKNGVDITSTNGANQTYSSGYYNITAYSSGNANYTSSYKTFWLNITKATPTITTLLNGVNNNLTIVYPQQVNASGSTTGGTLNIYRDGNLITNGINYSLGVGYYRFDFNVTGDENYTNTSIVLFANVTKATPILTFLANGGTSNLTLTYPQQINISASSNAGTIGLDKDNVNYLSNNGLNITLGVGSYIFRANITGNANYSDVGYSYYNITITKATQSITPLLNGNNANLAVTYPQQINASYSGTNYTALSIKINDTQINIAQNYTWQTGNWVVNYSASENENYSGFNSLLNLTINKGNSLVYTFLNNSRNNITINVGSSIAINSSLISGESIIKLYNNGSLINSGTNLYNLTLFNTLGVFNITTIYEETQNYSSSSETFFVNVTDLVLPSISYGEGTETSGSILNRNNIVVNATALDSESGLKNITIFLYNATNLINSSNSTTSPLFVNFTNLTDGLYYFNATAYDIAGNKNYTETRAVIIDTTAPSLILLSPLNNSWDSDGNLTFVYNVTDANNITNCSLILNNEINLTNSSVIKGVNNSFQLNDLVAGRYNWSINCLDVAGNTNTSELKSFAVILMSEFLGGDTTNLSNVNISNITNLVIDSPSYGKINFSESVDLSGGADVNRNVNISFNRIEINSSALPQLNKSARLYLYNLTFTTPRILRDGELCLDSICKQESYANGTLIFNVSSFYVYSAEETPTTITPPPSGGGGGGGAPIKIECVKDDDCNKSYSCFNNKCVKLFDVKIIRVDSPIAPSDFLDFTYLVKGMADIKGDVIIDFWLEKDGKIITTGKDTIYFGTFEEKTETTNMFLSSNIQEGTYTFYVQTDYQGHKTSSQRDIEIVKNPTSNLDLNLLDFPKIKEGQLINFSYLVGFNKDSPVSVVLKETIRKAGEVAWENERGIEVNRSTIINEEAGTLKSGDYQLEINAEYENKELKFLYDFSVSKKINYWLFLLIIPIILLLIVFIIWRRKTKKTEAKLEEVLKQLEEKQIAESIKGTEKQEEIIKPLEEQTKTEEGEEVYYKSPVGIIGNEENKDLSDEESITELEDGTSKAVTEDNKIEEKLTEEEEINEGNSIDDSGEKEENISEESAIYSKEEKLDGDELIDELRKKDRKEKSRKNNEDVVKEPKAEEDNY